MRTLLVVLGVSVGATWTMSARAQLQPPPPMTQPAPLPPVRYRLRQNFSGQLSIRTNVPPVMATIARANCRCFPP